MNVECQASWIYDMPHYFAHRTVDKELVNIPYLGVLEEFICFVIKLNKYWLYFITVHLKEAFSNQGQDSMKLQAVKANGNEQA